MQFFPTRVTLYLAIAVLILVSMQVLLHTKSTSPWLLFRPPFAKPNTTVLFMITSYAGEFTRRAIVRETYLSIPSKRSDYLFVIGQGNITEDVRKEQAKYKDIYIVDCDDGYYNLSDKIILGLKTAVEHFDFKFVVKVDTDTYVDVNRLIDFLKVNGASSPTFYAGVLGFWNTKEYGWRALDTTKRQPSMRPTWYMLGGGYAMSYNLALYFAENAHLLQVWAPEDLTIGVHLYPISVVPYPDTAAFLTHNDNMNCEHDYILNHKVSKEKMYYMHYSILESGRMCAYANNETLRMVVENKMRTSNISFVD